MSRITYFFRAEIEYFRVQVTPHAKRLVFSNILKTISNPLTTIFLNAFVWRSTGSLLSVSLYNAAQFIFLPIAFYVNGLLLRKYHIRSTFAFGAFLSGASSLALVLFGSARPELIPIYGALWGFGNGMYWGNRNYLELQETQSGSRNYFYGIMTSISALSKILVPLTAGWLIVLGEKWGWYSTTVAYWILSAVAALLLVWCAVIVRRTSFGTILPSRISRLGIGPLVNKRRALQIASGMLDGADYVPVLLVLFVVGNEGVLGSVTAVAAILTSFALYLYGRWPRIGRERISLRGSAFLYLASAILLALLPHPIGVVLYMILIGITDNFSSVATSSIFLSLSEEEMEGKQAEGYSFIFDNELFLNIGRLICIGIIVSLGYMTTIKTGLFFGPVLISLIHVLLVVRFLRK